MSFQTLLYVFHINITLYVRGGMQVQDTQKDGQVRDLTNFARFFDADWTAFDQPRRSFAMWSPL